MINYTEPLWPPPVLRVCHCEQCRGSKNKRKNRRLKKAIKRKINKWRRKNKFAGSIYTHYWA